MTVQPIEEHSSTKLAVSLPAPGGPGADPRWAEAHKDGVGAAITPQSHIWFTLVDGALSEVFIHSIDLASTRSLRFLVTDGREYFSDESEERYAVRQLEAFAPHYEIRTEDLAGRYRLNKEIVTDPGRQALLVNVQFEPLAAGDDLRLYLYVEPNVHDLGKGNDGWVGEYKSIPMLFAFRDELAVAVAASAPFKKSGAGFVGVNDGAADLRRHKQITWTYTEANDGNVALVAELDWQAVDGQFTVAMGGGDHSAEAAQQARAGLLQKFADVRDRYVAGWQQAQEPWLDLGRADEKGVDHYRVSAAVLQVHESKRFPGGIVASLSTPWGFARGDENTGGYHVLWPRDMGEAATGRLAHGDAESAARTLFFLRCTQEAAGNWGQNMWLDGTPHWTGTQMDGPALAILLADLLRREGSLKTDEWYSMVRSAAGFLLRIGPYTEQDRWEEDAGYTPFTMAAEIAALLAAADFAEEADERGLATFLRETADAWNATIDELLYMKGTPFAVAHGVEGYYIRIAPPEAISAGSPEYLRVKVKNRPAGQDEVQAANMVSVDALALVRFGLRSATDPRILDTVKVIDAELKQEVSTGPIWHRYTEDGYGEQEDGSPFIKTGKGRGWPLFAGERAHYEIAKGDFAEAERLRKAIEAQSNACGLIPEQVWDAADIPEKKLFNGRPTGSSMPLVWAHAEYIKLLRSLKERRVWDMPPQAEKRYAIGNTPARFVIWTPSQQRTKVPHGMDLRIDLPNPAHILWTTDHWQSTVQAATQDAGVGVHYGLLEVKNEREATELLFRIFWTETNKWEGKDFHLSLGGSPIA